MFRGQDENSATRMLHALLCDRTQEHSAEPAGASCPDHEKLSIGRVFHESLSRMSVFDDETTDFDSLATGHLLCNDPLKFLTNWTGCTIDPALGLRFRFSGTCVDEWPIKDLLSQRASRWLEDMDDIDSGTSEFGLEYCSL